MQTIAFMSYKGGAGKTTSLMLVASVLNQRGKRVALLDADENKPLEAWRTYSINNGTWDDENLKVWKAGEESDLEQALEGAETEAFDYALVDTKGGGSDLNQTILLNCDLIIIPTDLCVSELDEALKTLEYIHRLLKNAKMDIPSGFLLNRTPLEDEKFAAAEREGMVLMKQFPMFDARLPTHRAIKDIKGSGPLNRYYDVLKSSPGKRFRAPQVQVALSHGEALTDEILENLKAPEPV